MSSANRPSKGVSAVASCEKYQIYPSNILTNAPATMKPAAATYPANSTPRKTFFDIPFTKRIIAPTHEMKAAVKGMAS